jgi:methyl-accepting chemotaxis protein
MLTILRDAKGRFKKIQELLNNQTNQNNDYLTELSSATEEAYVLMNEGMCASTSVCHECAEHRDFIRSMLDILGSLEEGNGSIESYSEQFSQYSARVTKILTNIKAVLAS